MPWFIVQDQLCGIVPTGGEKIVECIFGFRKLLLMLRCLNEKSQFYTNFTHFFRTERGKGEERNEE